MRHVTFFSILALLVLLASATTATALSVATVPQGGTGWAAIQSGTVLLGNGTTRLSTTTRANLTNGVGITISGGTNAVLGAGASITCATASGSTFGCLGAADWTTFNSKQDAGNYITALTGDVTASGPGSVAASFALGNTHWWAARQNFTNASTSELTATSTVWFTALTSTLLGTDNNGKVVSTTTIGNSLLTNSGALTVSAGSGLSGGGSVALGGSTSLAIDFTRANSWTGLQTISAASTTNLTASSFWIIGQSAGCAQFDANAKLTSTGVNCGTGSGSAWPFTPASYNAVANQSTTTPLWLKDTMVIASTTYFTLASTTQLTNTGNTYLTGITNAVLGTDNNGLVGASTSIGTNYITGPLGTVNTSGPLGGGGTLNRGGTLTLTCSTCITALADPFTHTSVYGQTTSATSTLIAHTGSPFSLVASSTVNFVNASTTQLTVFSTGSVWFLNLASALLGTDNNGKLVATTTIGNSLLTNAGALTVNTSGPLAGGGSVALGGTLTLTCATCNTSNATVSSVGLSTPNSTLSIGSTPVTTSGTITADINLANPNTWTGKQIFATASSTLFSAFTAYFGGSATSSFSGTLATIPNASTTNMTAVTGWITGVTSALHLADSNGKITAYGGAAPCSSQFVTAISAIGGTTCASVTDATFSGQLGIAHGGTNAASLGSHMLLAFNGTSVVSTSTPTAASYLATSTTATSTFAGPLQVSSKGDAVGSAPTYLLVGSTTPITYANNDLIDAVGSRNDFVVVNSANNAPGTCATADFAVGNDKTTNGAYFGDLGHTSSAFTGSGCTNNPFTGFAANSTYLFDPDGDINIALGTTSASNARGNLKIFARGYAAANEVFRLTNQGQFGIGTTTPFWNLTVASSTGPQLALTDTTAASNAWTLRSTGNSFFLATSTATATSTVAAFSINPNGQITMPSVVSAVHLADSNGKITAANTQTCTNQFVRAMSAAYSATCATVSLTADVTGTLPAANGGTGTTATSTIFTFSQAFSNAATLSVKNHHSFTYGTSTAWTGTTTIPLESAFGETWNSVRCFTDAGTLNVDFYHATSHLNFFNASTTNNVMALSTNNTMTAGDKTYVDIGTPAASPKTINCTIFATE